MSRWACRLLSLASTHRRELQRQRVQEPPSWLTRPLPTGQQGVGGGDVERTTTRRDRPAGATTWARNAKGNLVAQVGSTWVTVYRDNVRYRFVRNHVFSREAYATEGEACEAARTLA